MLQHVHELIQVQKKIEKSAPIQFNLELIGASQLDPDEQLAQTAKLQEQYEDFYYSCSSFYEQILKVLGDDGFELFVNSVSDFF